jgi:hypothetical protein
MFPIVIVRARRPHHDRSEPIVDGEPWQEIPEDHVLTIDETLTAKLTPIPE